MRKITHRQKRAVKEWIDGGFGSKADALRKAGYSKRMIRNPERVFNSPAVIYELERLGFTPYGTRIDYPVEHIQVREPEENFDVSEISKEQLTTLKERLAEIGYTDKPKEEQIDFPYTSPEPGTDAFGAKIGQG